MSKNKIELRSFFNLNSIVIEQKEAIMLKKNNIEKISFEGMSAPTKQAALEQSCGQLGLFAEDPKVKAMPDMQGAFDVDPSAVDKFNLILARSTSKQISVFWFLLGMLGRTADPLTEDQEKKATKSYVF